MIFNMVGAAQGGGGSDDNFKIAMGAMSGKIYDSELTALRPNALMGCLTVTAIEMPNLQTLGSSACTGCRNVSEISLPACTSVGGYALAYHAITELYLPECITFGQGAAEHCYSLTKVNLPKCESVLSLAFYSDTNISEVYLPACKLISSQAFQPSGTNNVLRQLSLPMLNEIKGASVFYENRALESIYLLSTNVVSLGARTAFADTPISNSTYLGYFGSIYVPSSLVDTYKAATNWSYYSDRITAYVE